MDNLVFEESVNTEVSSSEFVDKQWLYVNDNNNSSYSGQVVIDTTSLSNCGNYINWSEAFLAIPLVLQLQADATLTDSLALDWALGMKSGYWQILHSLVCEFNNGNIIQQTPFLNVFTSFKNLTSWSKDDIDNWGALTGFHPDTASAWLFNDATNSATNSLGANGTGLSMNRIAPQIGISVIVIAGTPDIVVPYDLSTLATRTSGDKSTCINEGLMMRQRWLNFSLVLNTGSSLTQQASNKAGLLAGSSTLSSSAGMNAIFASYIQAGSTYRAIVLDAVIRLKDIADFFQKVPLLKGSTMRLYLNTNQCYFNAKLLNYQYTSTTGVLATAGSLTLTSTPVILGGGGTNPIMLASADLGQGLQPLVPLTSNAGAVVSEAITCGISIVRTQFPTSVFTQQISAPVSSVRLYAPAYTFSPIAEQRYLSLTPTKKVVYNDIFQYSFPSVGAGSPFNFLVSNGIPNVRGVLVVPLLPKASNGKEDGAGNYSGITTSTLYSPFCATGGAPDPVSFTNFNIQVSGKNLFINNLLYDFETFSQQFISSNQLNGSLTTGLTSGLVGYYEWENLFRYYYGNVSRSLPSEDGVAKAIQITGTNQSSKVVDIMVFVEFEREIVIDVRSGARIQ
jgi:hypothetical protein